MSDDKTTVTLQDMRLIKYCARGSRKFAIKHGLSWQDFITNGIPLDKLESTNDAMALKLVEIIRGRQR
jgi:hypothetical protein